NSSAAVRASVFAATTAPLTPTLVPLAATACQLWGGVPAAHVAGTMGTQTCHPERPVPVIHFHGTADEFVRYEGGPGAKSTTRTVFYSVEHTMSEWVAANGCARMPAIQQLPDTSDDEITVECRTYGPGRNGSEVVLYKINGGGHTWPGRTARAQFLGPSTRDISANDLMWEFFQKHPLP
ncbi:MAG: PHB depolymerase family esterase, partial [Planctomycetaceae bacterium]